MILSIIEHVQLAAAVWAWLGVSEVAKDETEQTCCNQSAGICQRLCNCHKKYFACVKDFAARIFQRDCIFQHTTLQSINKYIAKKLLQILSFLMHFSFTSDSKRTRGHSEGGKAESSRSRVDGRVDGRFEGGRLDGGHQSRTKEENSEKRRRQMRRTQSEAAVNKKVSLTVP